MPIQDDPPQEQAGRWPVRGNHLTPNATRAALINESDSTRGRRSPFVAWLRAQPDPTARPERLRQPGAFKHNGQREALRLCPLQWPKNYLFATCIDGGTERVPQVSTRTATRLHQSDQLDGYLEHGACGRLPGRRPCRPERPVARDQRRLQPCSPFSLAGDQYNRELPSLPKARRQIAWTGAQRLKSFIFWIISASRRPP